MKTQRRAISLALALAVPATGCMELAGPSADALAGCEGPEPALGATPLQHDPILFVHGYAGNGANWQDMRARFVADGFQAHALFACNYSFTASNAASATEIASQVEAILRRTGAQKVDIVAFSMGSISSRYYLRNLGGTARVDAWVSLAGPNHGTEAVGNNNCSFVPCREIVPGSDFLAGLNSGDPTPGPVRYATWRSACDTTIVPHESVMLPGAMNRVAPCVAHLDLLTNAQVYAEVRGFIG